MAAVYYLAINKGYGAALIQAMSATGFVLQAIAPVPGTGCYDTHGGDRSRGDGCCFVRGLFVLVVHF